MSSRNQIRGKKFTVVYRDRAEGEKMIALLRKWWQNSPRLPAPQGTLYSIDLGDGRTRIDIPHDEPWTAFSAENMVRLFGWIWKDGVLMPPEDWMPKVVTGEWVRAASEGWAPVEPIEGRYVDRGTSYFRDIAGHQAPPIPRKSVSFALRTKRFDGPAGEVRRKSSGKGGKKVSSGAATPIKQKPL